jgi:predicted CXXCH cytochrome family protein
MPKLFRDSSRLCRLMCGRSMTFRRGIRKFNRGCAPVGGIAPAEKIPRRRWGRAATAHQAAKQRNEGFVFTLLVVVAGVFVGLTLHSVSNSLASASRLSGNDLILFASMDPQQPTGDFTKFTHTNPMHSRLPCLLCHHRETTSTRPQRPGKGGHLPCAGCHAQQFANAGSPICTICHTDVQKGALKPFPPLRSFRVKFDHARHVGMTGVGCNTCHRPDRGGVAQSIPARANGHVVCYQCHTPRAQSNGRDISSCGTCHQLGSYSRTPALAQSFRVSFSHAKHGAPQKLSCNDCHNVKAGVPQRKQVSAPAPLNHHAKAGTESCMTCHNGKRAFGGDDFTSCKRCHQGPQWHF